MIDPLSTELDPISLLWAAPERAGDVAAIHAELFNPPWTSDAIQTLLEHPAAAALIAVAGMRREPAGFILAQLAGDEAEILSFGVAPRFQRRGLGRRLIEGLIRAAGKAEARRLFLEVGVDNTAALRLYEKLDFKRVGIRPKYYQRRGEPAVDALVLALEF
ncbi:MAG: ribosomal protein S18-alanine N-acetyltransferase [Hyphomicrobiaceae bacterium]|nr:ribosomal protein S18-alanine N-acetyltransferase [Hyphomicrobiaceae bacterium]